MGQWEAAFLFLFFRNMKLHKIVEYLRNANQDKSIINILPPINSCEDITDEDDGNLTDEDDGNKDENSINSLSTGQLLSEGEQVMRNNFSDSDSDFNVPFSIISKEKTKLARKKKKIVE